MTTPRTTKGRGKLRDKPPPAGGQENNRKGHIPVTGRKRARPASPLLPEPTTPNTTKGRGELRDKPSPAGGQGDDRKGLGLTALPHCPKGVGGTPGRRITPGSALPPEPTASKGRGELRNQPAPASNQENNRKGPTPVAPRGRAERDGRAGRNRTGATGSPRASSAPPGPGR
ncbi:hypothetical protein Sm713_37880 [Streptomyces sp. TS71-3]|nr:hypothetical protein Sm713_37880 [Streptomyces sp. TS71-3]